ncbi:Tyrosine-protein kinase ptk [Rosistilla ulvae]|uniref:Tyrosine-protein kinase ptk n=1 Tax=Rosistilla ulvae TaxID=1930277 RepID=A0A517M0G2_9BACT|nr:polysaccharide biosynthesis tyrosine autokinase [Rosistilla ulvae]QDS88362.1 Tyrosine-protein kinase ptk [Rosistilla ulvae]
MQKTPTSSPQAASQFRNHARPPVRAAHGAPSGSTDLDPKLLWVTIRHCWIWATPIGLALAAAAAFAVFSGFVPVYKASHLLEVNQDFVVFKGIMPTPRNLVASERPLVLNALVLEEVKNDPEVQAFYGSETPLNVGQLRSSVGLSNAGSSTLLSIQFEHEDPVAAATICNKITHSFLSIRDRLDNDRVSNLESWLTPSIDQWKNEVHVHGERVRDLSKVVIGYDPTHRVEGLENDLSVLAGLRTDLSNMIVEESILEAKVAMNAAMGEESANTDLDRSKVRTPYPEEIDQYVEADPSVVTNRKLLAERESRVRNLEDRGLAPLRQEYHKELKEKAAEQQRELDNAVAAARQRAPEAITERLRRTAERTYKESLAERKAASFAQRESINQQLVDLKARRAIIQQEYDIEKSRLEQRGGKAADLRFATEDREIAAGILGQLNQRLAAIRTERRRGSGLHTLAEATPPLAPVEPMPTKKMIVAAGGAFAIPFFLGLLWELRSQKICDSAKLESKLMAPIMGEVAKLPPKFGSRKGRRVFEESIDTLRANLLLSKETSGVRTLTIASSMSGEGKSSVASQLAISVAKASGKTVLLIDGDLRSPDQHAIFGLDLGPGLSKVLSGDIELKDAVDTSLGELVHVLPAGKMHQSPHRLVSASSIRDLLDQALEKYSFVIFDTAPVLAAGETLAIASETDATLVCVMRDVSRTDSVVRSSRRLEASGANVAGTVFSGVPSSQYAYRYGDYRYFTARPEPQTIENA